MANKAISELPQALNVNNQDLFVLEQSGIAKKLPAETFITEQGIINALAEALDGHGGISSVTLSSVSGRIRTYLITFTDGSATTFQVLDGTTITSIQKTSTAGLVDTYTVYMSDGTTSFFNVTNGEDGEVTQTEFDELKSALNLLGLDNIPGTTKTVNFDTDGKPASIVHAKSGEAVRTDTFTWGDGTVTERRTLADGLYVTMVTDLTTLVTTISEIQEAS